MRTSRLPRMLFITLSAVSVLFAQALGMQAASAATVSAVTAESATVGSTVSVKSTFAAPTWSGTFVLDTEVFNSSGKRVAQFHESKTLTKGATITRAYNWNTAGLTAGNYSFQQGLFKADWNGTVNWNTYAGTVTLKAASTSTSTSTGWMTRTTVEGEDTKTIRAKFQAPDSLTTQSVMLDTEVHNAAGQKVAQWASKTDAKAGQYFDRTYKIDTAKLAAGKYTVKSGVFSRFWASKLHFADTNTFTVSEPAKPIPTTTTTAAPKPTTTTTEAPAPSGSSSWNVDAVTSGSGVVSVASNFVAPNNIKTTAVQLDTEVYNAAGKQVDQWTEEVAAAPNQSFKRSYKWDTSDLANGTYTVKLGVFNTDWTKNYSWNEKAASVAVTNQVEQPKPVPTTQAPTPTTTPTTQAPVSNENNSGNPLVSKNGFYASSWSLAGEQAKAWKDSRPSDAAYMQRIHDGGAAEWLGSWSGDVRSTVNNTVSAAANQQQTPVFVAYNIPNRDCGSYSAGGAGSVGGYKGWIDGIAAGIGSRKAAVVLEPDALAQVDCLGSTQQAERYDMLSYAVHKLEGLSNTSVYLDAGHPGWITASTMADRLTKAGVADARGFSLNVSNFDATSANATYGDAISKLLGGKHYVVDTSRNGNGSNGEWCNPMGRALGVFPTTSTNRANADGYIWIKRPGESDGTCNGGPAAGQFWADYALGMAKRAWD